MKNHQLVSTKNHNILFSGMFADFKTCLEEAVRKRITLSHVNLRGQDLSNANLDDGILPYADFSHANLSGANMSECYCKHARFINTALFNTCFAYTNISNCSFQNAHFGATDMSGCIIDGSEFSTLSAFSIDFTKTRQMRNCLFFAQDGSISQISSPPIIISGLYNAPMIITENDAYIGHRRRNKKDVLSHLKKICKNNLTNQSEIA